MKLVNKIFKTIGYVVIHIYNAVMLGLASAMLASPVCVILCLLQKIEKLSFLAGKEIPSWACFACLLWILLVVYTEVSLILRAREERKTKAKE